MGWHAWLQGRPFERAAQYDAMAGACAANNLDSPFNAYYERPATQRLLGEVNGKQHAR